MELSKLERIGGWFLGLISLLIACGFSVAALGILSASITDGRLGTLGIGLLASYGASRLTWVWVKLAVDAAESGY